MLHALHPTLEMLDPMVGHPMVLPAPSFTLGSEEFPARITACCGNNSPSERMRVVPAGTRLHLLSSPGPGDSPGHQVPAGFFALPAWESVGPETALERSCHQRRHGMACRVAGAGRQPWLGEDSRGSQGSWQRLNGAVSAGLQLSSGLCSGPWSKRVRAVGFPNSTDPPGSARAALVP